MKPDTTEQKWISATFSGGYWLIRGPMWHWLAIPMSSSLPPNSPLGMVLRDIDRAIDAKLYYPALLVTLTVPEICSALCLTNDVYVKQVHYVGFIDKYTEISDLGLSGLDCYQLRGGVVHRANMAAHPHFGATHVIFTVPETGAGCHAFSIVAGEKTAVMLDLVLFCKAMISAAHRWYDDHKDDELVVANMHNLIRYAPSGVSPFVGGAPVVASGK